MCFFYFEIIFISLVYDNYHLLVLWYLISLNGIYKLCLIYLHIKLYNYAKLHEVNTNIYTNQSMVAAMPN